MMDIEYLTELNLVQEPPRRRMFLAYDGPTSLEFPWVSIGADIYGRVYVFFHDRAWRDMEDALGILRIVGPGFHAYDRNGIICLDGQEILIRKRQITPAEAFWMTRSEYSACDFRAWYPEGIAKGQGLVAEFYPEVFVTEGAG